MMILGGDLRRILLLLLFIHLFGGNSFSQNLYLESNGKGKETWRPADLGVGSGQFFLHQVNGKRGLGDLSWGKVEKNKKYQSFSAEKKLVIQRKWFEERFGDHLKAKGFTEGERLEILQEWLRSDLKASFFPSMLLNSDEKREFHLFEPRLGFFSSELENPEYWERKIENLREKIRSNEFTIRSLRETYNAIVASKNHDLREAANYAASLGLDPKEEAKIRMEEIRKEVSDIKREIRELEKGKNKLRKFFNFAIFKLSAISSEN